MCKVVQPIRKLIFEHKNTFKHSFSEGAQLDSVPKPLLVLMSMLIEGNSFESNDYSQASLSCAQLVQSNASKLSAKSTSERRYEKDRETPMKIYVTLKVYFTAGITILINSLFKLGLCVC